MKTNTRINYILWKQGPLLFDLAHIVQTLPGTARQGVCAVRDLLSKSCGVLFQENRPPRLLRGSNT